MRDLIVPVLHNVEPRCGNNFPHLQMEQKQNLNTQRKHNNNNNKQNKTKQKTKPPQTDENSYTWQRPKTHVTTKIISTIIHCLWQHSIQIHKRFKMTFLFEQNTIVALFWTFYVFGSCFRTLAWILVSDVYDKTRTKLKVTNLINPHQVTSTDMLAVTHHYKWHKYEE